MAKKQDDPVKTGNEEGLLAAAAKKIGAAAGAVASLAKGNTHPGSEKTKSASASGRLQPKNKSRLPRRQKKALKKASLAARSGAV